MTWFKYDIGGYILLRGNRPVAQISDSELAMETPSLLARKYNDENFTLISSDGYHTTRVDRPEDDAANGDAGDPS